MLHDMTAAEFDQSPRSFDRAPADSPIEYFLCLGHRETRTGEFAPEAQTRIVRSTKVLASTRLSGGNEYTQPVSVRNWDKYALRPGLTVDYLPSGTEQNVPRRRTRRGGHLQHFAREDSAY
jgi:hypothetical protein